MNTFETRRLWLKIAFAVVAILLPIVLPFLAPHFGIREGARISLNGLQVLYAVLSTELALAVYMWGVGNWSRFEPPHISQSASAVQTGGPAQTPKPGPTPAGSLGAGAGTPAPGTPPSLLGAR